VCGRLRRPHTPSASPPLIEEMHGEEEKQQEGCKTDSKTGEISGQSHFNFAAITNALRIRRRALRQALGCGSAHVCLRNTCTCGTLDYPSRTGWRRQGRQGGGHETCKMMLTKKEIAR
jgi:hypothetical protein